MEDQLPYKYYTTNDGCKIAYQDLIPQRRDVGLKAPTTCILLLHGFSGSSLYFKRNMNELAQTHKVVAPDMRGHGRSSRTSGGYHVARLAQDLHHLVTLLRGLDSKMAFYAVGCSIGAAVLWTYVELFTDADFSGFVFVDQAPLQDRSNFDNWGPGLAHYECYDEATLLEAQRSWASDDESVREATYKGLVESCLGYRYAPSDDDNISKDQARSDEAFFTGISRECDGKWLARLLADHTRYDHREAIEMISKPLLVLAGRRSGCFSIDGMREIVRRAQRNSSGNAILEIFDSGHWLFWEETAKFNQRLLVFVSECEASKAPSIV